VTNTKFKMSPLSMEVKNVKDDKVTTQ
jgi:hypothetical protein